MPFDDFRFEPQLYFIFTPVDYGAGHVHVSILVNVDTAGFGKSKNFGNLRSINQLLG